MKFSVGLPLLIATLLSLQCYASEVLEGQLREMRRIDAHIAEPAEKAHLLERSLEPMMRYARRKGFDQLADDEVRDLYDAARMAAFYANSAFSTQQMKRALDELERRKIALPASADEMIATFVAARMFKDARTYHQAHRATARHAPPQFRDLKSRRNHPTVLEASPDGSTLVRRELARVDGNVVLVVGSPWCQFSRMATDAIESDPALASLMAKHAVWMIPQQLISDLPSVAAWNRSHPATPMVLMYERDEWAFMKSAATPGFYFFKDGNLVQSFSGWPGSEQKAVLLAALHDVGIGPDNSPR